MHRPLTLALTMGLIAAAPALAASQVHGPAVSAGASHHKPCGHARRRGCRNVIQISSFQWGVSRGVTAPTHGASAREGSVPGIGEINVHKPKHKGR